MSHMAACSTLANALGAKVGYPGSTLYEESTTSYFTALDSLALASILPPPLILWAEAQSISVQTSPYIAINIL